MRAALSADRASAGFDGQRLHFNLDVDEGTLAALWRRRRRQPDDWIGRAARKARVRLGETPPILVLEKPPGQHIYRERRRASLEDL